MSTSSVNYIAASTASQSGGVGAGIDVGAMVDAAMSAARQPEVQWQEEQTTLSAQSTVLNSLSSELTALQTSIQALTDPNGQFDNKLTTSSDTTQVNATASPTALVGTHSVTVTNIATTSSYTATLPGGGSLTDGNTAFGQGSFYLQVGTTNPPVQITVDSTDDTLSGLASSINSQNLGVTASVVTDNSGARLALYSETSGAAGNITIDPTTNTTGLSFAQGTKGVDASLLVDGIQIDSSSNTISTVIPGVTLNLSGATDPP